MEWICIMGSVLLTGLVLLKRNYKKEFVRQHRKEFGWIYPIAPCMLWLSHWWSKKEPGKREEKYARAVFVGRQQDNKREIYLVRGFGRAFYCLMTGFLLVLIIRVTSFQEKLSPNQGIVRPAFGEEEEYSFSVDGLTGETEKITVTVEGVQPKEKEMIELFDGIMEKIKIQILGDNMSLDEVRSDLNLPMVSDYGVRLEWKSSHPQLINDWGEIQEEKVMEEVSEEGCIISYSVRLTYASYESNYQIHMCLMPPLKDEEYLRKQLISEIHKREKESVNDSVFYLPKQLGERQLYYEQILDDPETKIPILAMLAAGLMIWFVHSRLKDSYEKRNEQIQRDYVQLLAKMGILLRAGLTIRGAWERIVNEYEGMKHKNPEKMRYVYEEMSVTWNQIRNGRPEGTAYSEFGRRCGTYAYVKFGNILEHNLKQGIAGISQTLETEMTNALEQRKNAALQRGEEAQTKLLFPMFLMLGIVLVILLIPAFLSF